MKRIKNDANGGHDRKPNFIPNLASKWSRNWTKMEPKKAPKSVTNGVRNQLRKNIDKMRLSLGLGVRIPRLGVRRGRGRGGVNPSPGLMERSN